MTRRRLRKIFASTVIVLSCLLCVLFIAGDRLTRRGVVSDGRELLPQERWDEARRFLWKEQDAELAGCAGQAPATDPLRRDLYFARKGEESGWDLWRASWRDGGYAEPVALFEINTLADETDPVVIEGGRALLFASSREGGHGGYDLWRAPLGPDGIGTPENLGPTVNGEGDERGPSCDAAGLRMVFSSNRRQEKGLRHDLFEATRLPDGWSTPTVIPGLRADDALADLRSPALAPDGRFLVFSCDRGAGRDFDLYRVPRHRGRWQEAELLSSLSTDEDELDAEFLDGGARLVFARARPDAIDTELRFARSEEIVLLLREDGLRERLLYLLAALLMAAGLTWLYLQWETLHPFVKFLILSAIVHILILLYVQTRKAEELPGFGGDQSFSIDLVHERGPASGGKTRSSQGDRLATPSRVQASATPQAAADEARLAPAASRDAEAPSTRMEARPDVAAESAASLAAEAPSRSSEFTAEADRAPAMNPAERRAGDAAPAGSAVARASSQNAERVALSSTPSGAAPAATLSASNSPQLAPPTQDSPLQARDALAKHGDQVPARSVPGRSEAKAAGSGRPTPLLAQEGTRRSAPEDPGTRGSAVAKANDASGAAAPSRTRARADGGGIAAKLVDIREGRDGGSPSGKSGLLPRAPAAETAPGRRALAATRRLPRALGKAERAAEAAPRRSGAPAASETPVVAAARPLDGERLSPRSRALQSGPRTEKPAASLSTSKGPSPRSTLRRRGDRSRRSRAPIFGTRRRSALAASGLLPTRATAGARSSQPSKAPGREADREARAVGNPRLLVNARGVIARSASSARSRGPRRGPRAGSDPQPRQWLLRREFRIAEPVSAAPAILARRRGAARLEALREAGGSAETEAAVLSGLRYLKRTQERDGSWGDRRLDEKYGDVRVGKSALCLLAFLGAGHTQKGDHEFKNSVQRGLGFIVRGQHGNGHLGDGSAYGHGIGTYALAEAYAMSSDPALRQPLKAAVRRILDAQVESEDPRLDGGWSYYYADEGRRYDRWPRLSVSVWQIMALESARIGGITVPDRALSRARSFVLASHDRRRDALRYNHDPSWLRDRYPILPGSVSAGLFALQLLGVDAEHPACRDALAFVGQRRPDRRWRRSSTDAFVRRGRGNEYYLYYATLALRMIGGERWQQWNEELKGLLLPSQDRDGSWAPISYYAEYAQDHQRSRAYTTATCVLMLEVYYRYDTPLLRRMARAFATRTPSETEGPKSRVSVVEITRGSSGWRAGLRSGDTFLEVAGKSIHTIDELQQSIAELDENDRTPIRIERGRRQRTLTLEGALEGLSVREEEP